MVDESIAGEATPPELDAEAAFAADARAAGLVLPKKPGRKDPWDAVVIIVALIVLTAGIGEVTGWVNLRAPVQSSGNFETQTCTGYTVGVDGSVSSAINPVFASWLAFSGQNLSQAVGGCFSVAVNPHSGDGYLPLLGGPGSEFIATYTPPTSSELSQLPDAVAVLPVALSAVAVVYNLGGIPTGLNLTGSILAGIYNGTISSWADPAIASLNPADTLSGLPPITPVHLSGSTVSNQVLTGFLAASSPAWQTSVGSGMSVAWPTGPSVGTVGAMISEVAATPGAVGYLQIFGVPPSGLGYAQIEDVAGVFASPGPVDSWVAANSVSTSSAVTTGNWSNFSLYDAPAVGSYPLASLSFAGIYRDLGVAYSGSLSLTNATWLLTYLYWVSGESAVAPLPTAFSTDVVNVLNNETYDGTTIVHLEDEYGENGEGGGETGEF